MLNKYFCTIFVIDYNLISYANNNHKRTRAVSLQMGTCIKGTVMQIEKALINDRLRVLKLS